MTARPGARGGVVAALGAVLLGCRLACAEAMPAEVRVVSTPPPQPTTSVSVRARPDTIIEDRTVGAKPAAGGEGPASTGETFQDEITLFLRALETSKAAAVEVADPLVSTVRVLPEATGTTVIIFVRQPVMYTVARPSAVGDVLVTLHGRQPAPSAAPSIGPTGQIRAPKLGAGEKFEEQSPQIQIDAEELTYDQETDTTIARGSVTVTRGFVTLQADEVRYHRLTGLAEATGHVVISDPEAIVKGDAASLDTNDESGWMERIDGTFSSTGYSLNATKMTKGVGPSYHIEDSVFTTCHCGGVERPSWSIGGKRTNIALDGMGVSHGATLRVKDIPVLWIPLLAFPANRDRMTGFLFPRFGYSNRRGFQYEQPFFWAINKSMDATVALDIETSARIGLIGEYRYVLSGGVHGAFGGGFWNEAIRSSTADEVLSSQGILETPPENRWLVVGQHRSPFMYDSNFYLDVFTVSDTSLLKEITNFSGNVASDLRLVRSTTYTSSATGLVKAWNGGLVQGEANYYQDLVDPQDLALQRAPYLRAEQSLPLLGGLAVGRLAGEATDYQRNEAYDGLRGDLAPELFVPFNAGPFLHGSLTGQLHGTLYELNDPGQQVALVIPNDPNVATTFRTTRLVPALDASHTRGVPVVRGVLGTELSRVFTFEHFGLEKIRHSIEPELRYLYVPPTDQHLGQQALPDTLPDDPGCPACLQFDRHGNCVKSNPNYGVFCKGTVFTRGYLFDGLDAIEHRSFFSYGITSRLLGRGAVASDKPPPPPDPAFVGPPVAPSTPAAVPSRELLRGSITSGWDVSREITPPSHFANVDLGLRFTPVDYLALSYAGSFAPVQGRLAAQTYAMVLREPNYVAPKSNPFQSPTTVGVSYRFVEQNVNEVGIPPNTPESRLFANGGLEETDAYVYIRLGDYAGFTFVSRYDLNGGQLVKQNGRLENVGPHFIERDYLLRLISRCNCWAAEFGVSDRFDTGETLYRFQITLLGLGSFGQGPAGSYIGFAPLQALGLRRPPALGGSYF